MRVSVVIPTHNEAQTIGGVLEEVKKYNLMKLLLLRMERIKRLFKTKK
ncbi:hypothetical protein NKR74_02355 [Bacillus sp. 3103sda1]|nr:MULTISPECIES: hypothetical protein [unclassified Bacillus (in: firmicutes)]MCP1122236.1 hypothetical protein [Bacillus sp. 3103sda1]